MYQQRYYGNYYPYPPNYSYYPQKGKPYALPKKPLWPIALVVVGILLIAYGFVFLPKMDPQIKKYAALYPDRTMAAIVFCNPCTGIEGENVGSGKVLVIDKAVDILDLASNPGVRQVRYLKLMD